MSKHYIHGHSDAVLRDHMARTVANSAAYVISSLKPDMHILDIGCGPGSITIDFALRTPDGQVVGLDQASTAVEKACHLAEQLKVDNVDFVVGKMEKLPFPDATFDLVHAHHVVQYQSDPVGALREMRRVTKPGGLVAVRDWDCASAAWFPANKLFDEWKERYTLAMRSLGGEPDAGRHLVSWALQAGFDRRNITATAGTWCYSSPEERAYLSETMSGRIAALTYTGEWTEQEVSTLKAKFTGAWHNWASQDDGWYVAIHGEILCRA